MSFNPSIPLMPVGSQPAVNQYANQQIDVSTLASMDPKSLELIRDILKMQNQGSQNANPPGGVVAPVPVSYGSATGGPPVYGTIKLPQQYVQVQPNYNDPRGVLLSQSPIYQPVQQVHVKTPFEDQAIKLWNEAFKEKNSLTKYEKYQRCLHMYKGLPQDSSIKQDIVTLYNNILLEAVKIRDNKRKAVDGWCNALSVCCFGLGILAPCGIYWCVKSSSAGWVESLTLLSLFESAIDAGNDLIATVLAEHHYQLGMNKDSFSQASREVIAKAFASLAKTYTISDQKTFTEKSCACDCCFGGSQGTKDASKKDLAKAVANYQQAMEWNPSNTEYATSYQKYDSEMKAPVINVTYFVRR